MADWEDESDSAPAAAPAKAKAPVKAPVKVVGKGKWADEDEDDDKGSADWDASSDEEKKKPARPIGAAVAAAPKKKGTLKAKLAQKEADRAAREAAGDDDAGTGDEFLEDAATTKARLREAELAADLGNAASLLGGSSAGGGGSQTQQLAALLTASPKTKDDFQLLAQQLMTLVVSQHSNKPLYAVFVELFARELAGPLRDVETRKVASTLTALANEKQKDARDKAAGKAKKKTVAKPALGIGKTGGRLDTQAYDEALDDFGKGEDDFM